MLQSNSLSTNFINNYVLPLVPIILSYLLMLIVNCYLKNSLKKKADNIDETICILFLPI